MVAEHLEKICEKRSNKSQWYQKKFKTGQSTKAIISLKLKELSANK